MFRYFTTTPNNRLWGGDVILKEKGGEKTNGFWKKSLKKNFWISEGRGDWRAESKKTVTRVGETLPEAKHDGHDQKSKITVGWTRLAKPKPTLTHGNGREPSRKKTTWETSFETGRRSGEGREVAEWRTGLESTSGWQGELEVRVTRWNIYNKHMRSLPATDFLINVVTRVTCAGSRATNHRTSLPRNIALRRRRREPRNKINNVICAFGEKSKNVYCPTTRIYRCCCCCCCYFDYPPRALCTYVRARARAFPEGF